MIGLAGVVLSCTFMSHQHYHQVHIQVIQYMVAYWKRKQLDYCDHSMTERIFMPLMTNVNVKLLWTKKCLFANKTERGFLSQKVDHEYHFFTHWYLTLHVSTLLLTHLYLQLVIYIEQKHILFLRRDCWFGTLSYMSKPNRHEQKWNQTCYHFHVWWIKLSKINWEMMEKAENTPLWVRNYFYNETITFYRIELVLKNYWKVG